MIMRVSILLVTCLAYAGLGQKPRISRNCLHRGLFKQSGVTQLATCTFVSSRSDNQAEFEFPSKSAKVFAQLLLACASEAAFRIAYIRIRMPLAGSLLAISRLSMPAAMAEMEEFVIELVEGADGKWKKTSKSVSNQVRHGRGSGRKPEVQSKEVADPQIAAAAYAEGLGAFAVRSAEGAKEPLVDIGVNLGKLSQATAELQLRRAALAGVTRCIATGTTLSGSTKSLGLCRHLQDHLRSSEVAELFCTAGVHPHYASSAPVRKLATALRELYKDPLCVSIGECGLDYDRMRSPKTTQLAVFAAQARLAAELDAPIFCHERDLDSNRGAPLGSHDDLCRIVDEAGLRPDLVCVHCYTGSVEHLVDYVERGYMIGLTGFIGMQKRGAHLREALANGVLPLSQLMVETDAPYMKPDKQYLPKEIGLQRENEPCVTPAVVRAVAELLGKSESEVAKITTANALRFFRLS